MHSVATLTSLEWHQLNKLLEKALELDPPQRATWVEQHTDLKPELQSALRALLEKAAAEDDDEFASPFAAEHHAGEVIGPYRLVRELAQGGMGVVWVGERADGSFERQVALKLPRPEWAAPGLAERMARERAILASLNHPNIAQLYDAGWTSDGRPFLALELVEGVPIDSYVATHSLGIKERLELFVDVVRAVAFAHTRLIVHRDLKPANVLVTTDGTVKLLDFGISKLTLGDQAGAETVLTRASGRAMTLAYAAPEQILGQPVSAATDAYALGVMLYELLTGSRPYRPKHDSKLALEEAVLYAEPRPPSKVVASQNARELRGDLDTVVLKALKKQPAERYATASEFADDLEAFLAHHPVKARPDSRLYRARLFVRRNRLALGVTSALAATLLLGGGLTLWQVQATRAEAQRADTIKEFVLAMIRQADPALSAVQRERDDALLAAAEERISSALEARPEMAMELRLAVAEAHRNRGTYDRARAVLLDAVKEGRRTLTDEHPLMARARIKLADRAILGLDNIPEELDRAIATARAMGSAGHELLVEGLIRRSGLEREGPSRPVIEENREAYEIALRHLGPDHPLTLEAACHLSDVVPRAEALEVMAKAYGSARANARMPAAHPVLLIAQAHYGKALAWQGQADEGLRLALEAVDVARHNHGVYGKATEETTALLTRLYDASSNQKGAVDATREAYRITTVREPPTSLNRRRRAKAYAMNALGAGVLEGVAQAVDEVLNVDYAPEFEKRRPAFEAERKLLNGLFLLESGDLVRAERLLEESAREFESLKPGVGVSDARFFWAMALLDSGRAEEALRFLQERLKLPTKSYSVAALMAHCHLAMGDPRAALRLIDETDALHEPAERAAGGKPEMLYSAKGRALLELGRPKEAVEPLRKLHDYWAPFGEENPYTAEALYWYGLALIRMGDAAGGKVLVESALPALMKSPKPQQRAIAARAQTS